MRQAIRAAIDRLDQATRRFAELMMDSAVTGALGGKTMQAAGESIGEGPTAPHPFAKAQVLAVNAMTTLERALACFQRSINARNA